MNGFIKGRELCEGFFFDCAKGIIDTYFPDLVYSAGLIGYGSDVLGYDDEISTDHMWGPRFYMFLSGDDISKRDIITEKFTENLPCTYKGYSVNFSSPDMNDNGVRHPEYITEGRVNPLIIIETFEDFLTEQLGTADIDSLTPFDWLSFSEHRLLSIVSGKFYTDGLRCSDTIEKIRYYPDDVKLYLIASQWTAIASEQAFMRRCGDTGDDIGSRIICARIAERLMRLCFIYKNTYSPYSKWFGRAFAELDADSKIKDAVSGAMTANDLDERENRLTDALLLTGGLHNLSGVTEKVDFCAENYYGRKIKVIFAEKFAEAAADKLKNTAFENIPPIGTFSQLGGISDFSDNPQNYGIIKNFYGNM